MADDGQAGQDTHVDVHTDTWHEQATIRICHRGRCVTKLASEWINLHDLAAPQVARAWPFARSPGAVAAELDAALKEFGNMLAAVRHVFIEHAEPLAAPAQHDSSEREIKIEAEILAAARVVIEFDWSDNDSDAVDAIERLRSAVQLHDDYSSALKRDPK